jgi:hypothetical protein
LITGYSRCAFLHEYTDTRAERLLLNTAERVFWGNAELFTQVAGQQRHAMVCCPGAIASHDRFDPVELSVLSFGVAHKPAPATICGCTNCCGGGRSYCPYLSAALHEHTSFEESFNSTLDEIKSIFGPRVHFLGFLSDAAVYNYLLDCTYFATFFERGVPNNYTSGNAAMACGL